MNIILRILLVKSGASINILVIKLPQHIGKVQLNVLFSVRGCHDGHTHGDNHLLITQEG